MEKEQIVALVENTARATARAMVTVKNAAADDAKLKQIAELKKEYAEAKAKFNAALPTPGRNNFEQIGWGRKADMIGDKLARLGVPSSEWLK